MAPPILGVTAILHTASPVNFQLTGWDNVVGQAVGGATGILQSAIQHAGPGLESFVLTSSVGAMLDPSPTKDHYTFSEVDWNEWAIPKAKELGDAAPSALLYYASKVASERAVWEIRDSRKVGPFFSFPPTPTSIGPPRDEGPTH